MFDNDAGGHAALIGNGYDYNFYHGPDPLRDMEAPRAIFAQYQSYPENSIAGMATLTRGDGFAPGKYLSVLQHPQVFQNQNMILSDMLAGGTPHGTIAGQSLISFSDSNQGGF